MPKSNDTITEIESLQRICKPLLSWYVENRRQMEWRQKPLPYYVWVSEIMLQQTRVEAVRPYFSRFVRTLPKVRDLALCDEDRLLKLWEGLGYYSRARNLKKAAQLLMEQSEGVLPADVDALRKLPGIGSYTAGAIASIAFGIPAPAVDGNVLRVLTRILACEDCIDEATVKTRFEDSIRTFLVRAADGRACGRTHGEGIRVLPGDFNQALMELGATVCLPNGEPLCGRCPVSGMCLAKKQERTLVIPVRKKKRDRRVEKKTILVIRDSERVIIRKRPGSGLLAGLWEFPNYEGHLSQEQALRQARHLGAKPVRIRPLPEARHIFTHVEWEMTGFLILAEEMDDTSSGCPAVGIRETEKEYPIPAAFSRFAAWATSDVI